MEFFKGLFKNKRTLLENEFLKDVELIKECAIKASANKSSHGPSFVEVCTICAQNAALDFILKKKEKGVTAIVFDGLSTDILIFETTACFMSCVKTFIGLSPEIPDEIRPELKKRFLIAVSILGRKLEMGGKFEGGENLLQNRVDSYPFKFQEMIGFFMAVLNESRGQRKPVVKVMGGPPSLDLADGIITPLIVTAFSATELKYWLEKVFDFVKLVLEKPDFNDKNESIALKKFEREIEEWPPDQAQTALLLIKATLQSDRKRVEEFHSELTFDHLKSVQKTLEGIVRESTS